MPTNNRIDDFTQRLTDRMLVLENNQIDDCSDALIDELSSLDQLIGFNFAIYLVLQFIPTHRVVSEDSIVLLQHLREKCLECIHEDSNQEQYT